MTAFDRFEREIPRLMDELSPPQLPDYLDDMLRQTARTSQRPAWSALERWLPMGVSARTQTLATAPWRPILIVATIALLILATLVAIGVGSLRTDPIPAPFGLARNGTVLFSTTEGDIVRADPVTGEVATLIAGGAAEFNADPWFSNDGTRFVFERRGGSSNVQRALYIANADGSGVRPLTDMGNPLRSLEWSPTGDRLVIVREGDPRGQLTVIDTATGTPTTIDIDREVVTATWRPGTDELLIASGPSILLVNADGTGLRTVVSDQEMLTEQNAVSPDGSLLAYSTWGAGGEGRIHVVDIDTGVARDISFDPGFPYTDLVPRFTPDGQALVVERHDDQGYKATILPLDGGPAVPMGPYHPSSTGGVEVTLSPDGTQALAVYRTDGTTWLLDTATGEGRQLDWEIPADGVGTWQRLAP